VILIDTDPVPSFRIKLELEDASEYEGIGVGFEAPVSGEIVFNTGMTGYAEALTDPSYAGQILVFTYPLIGNYGVPSTDNHFPPADDFQSRRVQVEGVIVQRLAEHHSHHRATRSLEQWLRAAQVPLMTGVDTRTLTQRLRGHGTMRGLLYPAGMSAALARREARRVEMQREVFRRVAPAEPVIYPGGELRVMLVDVGAKDGIARCLCERGATVVRVPWHADLQLLACDVDGILIGNGPGDPSDLGELTAQVHTLLARFNGPIFGVCLGHQILARAAGLDTYKLPYGHRGINQPVQDIVSGRCHVTSQNHGYAVSDPKGMPDCEPWFVNLNDGTNEGLRWRDRPFFSVQFHPEGRPGPRDTEFLFDDFLRVVGELRSA
jgi:carbamoyl-phosphate synthase small subunit